MNFFVAVTNYDWFLLHASKPGVEEVNFWRPSSTAHGIVIVNIVLRICIADCRRVPMFIQGCTDLFFLHGLL
jgi:hypothetical protein